jgi:segregation and condensation protein A
VAPKLDLSNLTLEGLLDSAAAAFAKSKEKKALGTVIAPPKVTIREKIDLISKTMKAIQRATFRSLLEDRASRIEIVVTFLALLELIKRYRVTAHQEDLFGEIEFERMEDWTDDEEIEIEFE